MTTRSITKDEAIVIFLEVTVGLDLLRQLAFQFPDPSFQTLNFLCRINRQQVFRIVPDSHNRLGQLFITGTLIHCAPYDAQWSRSASGAAMDVSRVSLCIRLLYA